MTILEDQSTVDRIKTNTLLYPLTNVILSNFKPSRDIIKTYESSLDHIEDIVSKQSIVNEMIHTKIPGIIVEFKYWVDNIRIYGPNTQEHINYSANFCNVRTPTEALLERKTYCCLLLGDVNYSYRVLNIYDSNKPKPIVTKFSNAYYVNVPLPIGSKYDSLQDYDELTLIRSAETMEGVNGCFIVGGFIKYLSNILKKPFNQPMIRHNEYDNQKSRMECLYSAGLDYDNSYYVIGSMVQPKQSHISRGINQIPIVDFVFSLQMNDNTMNKEIIISRKKALINVVPIKYLFWAFGCQSDEEMMKYICPDMNDYGLIHTIRQAVLEGELHMSAIKGIVDYTIQYGFIHFTKPLDMITARYIVGSIILSDAYKKKVREKCKDDINMYKLEIIRQTDRLLRTKFMPGINKLNCDLTLYDTEPENLNEEQLMRLNNQERERNQAICYELGDIVRQLYLIGNDIEPSMDRISLLNRRVRSGQQVEYEFKSFNNARTRECKVEVEEFLSKYDSIDSLKDMKSAFDNRIQQIIKKTNMNQSTSLLNSFKGVATKDKSKIKTQLLQLKNQSFCDSMIREIFIGSDQANTTGGVQWEHRVVHPSHLYFIDPAYSPEGGHQVGRNQQPTLYTYLTDGSLGTDIYEFIKNFNGYLSKADDGIKDKYIIKLNGSNIGYIHQYDPVENLYKALLQARRDGTIIRDCSVTLKHLNGVLDIWCDEGRLMNHFVNVSKCFMSTDSGIVPRPEFIDYLKRCQSKEVSLTDAYEECIKKGYIELVCSSMAVYNFTIASNMSEYLESPWKFSHIALPLELLGYVCSINPSTPLNAGVRASYSSNHMKQAIGPTLRYPQCKYINELNILLSPQIPLVRPMNYDLLGYNSKPMGNNIIIAFLMYTDNQEDSFIVNRSSVENGFLVIDSLFTMQSEIRKGEESFKLPDESTPKNGNIESYLKLDPDTCLPKNIGDRFYENDVIIGKTVQINMNDVRKSDASVINTHMDACHPREANTRELRYVNKDKRIDTNKNLKLAVLSQRRVSIAGDKFNSTNAQKGTIGRIYDTDKMPYTSTGIRPDIIFNPPSIFKRNTCGQLYEPSLAKLAALLGCPIDTTPYATLRSTEEIDTVYERLGLDKYGYEDLYDPESGRYLGKVFVAVIQQQRQQHLVENKLNIRAGEGDIDKVSGLPVKGRKRAGGQSIDRMGNDSINCSGSVGLLKDVHLEQGCKMKIAICNRCHRQYTYYSRDYNCWFCANCGRHTDFTIKEVARIQPLINQVMTGLHVTMEYRTHNKHDDNTILEDADTTIY